MKNMSRKERINNYLKYWQIRFNLQTWDLSVQTKKFNRPNYPQTGDIDVDLKNKKAIVFLSETDTGIDNKIILHELIHLLLWDWDIYSEKNIPEKDKDIYFQKLEKTTEALTSIFLQEDR